MNGYNKYFYKCEFIFKFGFIIIPIATSIATWIGVLIYIYLLNQKKSLLLNIN